MATIMRLAYDMATILSLKNYITCTLASCSEISGWHIQQGEKEYSKKEITKGNI